MLYSSENLIEQQQLNAVQAIEKIKGKIPVLEISLNRIDALREMAELYINGNRDAGTPNGKFNDSEVWLWELFLKVYKTTI